MPLDDLSSLSSNPIDPSAKNNPAQPEVIYAPFDARARARVEDLTREEEDLLREIAALKKSVPSAAAATWGESVKTSLKEDEEALAAYKEKAAAAGAGEDGGVRIDGLERQADVERNYVMAVEGLGRLKREMPAVVARMERARGAGGYVVTER
jgi:kinetochor protein Mis14/NSL1